MEKSFEIDFSSIYHILAMAKWKLKELPAKDKNDIKNIEICEKLQFFLLKQEEDVFKITPTTK